MKKTQMKAGELYGYATGTTEYRSPVPVIVLDVGQLWTWRRNIGSDNRQYRTSNATRPRSVTSRFHGDDGYLVLKGTRFGDSADKAETLAAMSELWSWFAQSDKGEDAVNELARKVSQVRNVQLEIINNRWVEGPYAETLQAEADRAAKRDAKWRQQHAEEAERRNLRERCAAALRKRGYGAQSGVGVVYNTMGPTRFTVDARVLADLLGVDIEEGA